MTLPRTPPASAPTGAWRGRRRCLAAVALVLAGSATLACTADDGARATTDPAADATRARFADIDPTEPGCTVAVAVEGEVVFAEAFGAASTDPLEPLTPDTPVDIASTSKQFTAIAVGQLVLDGKVALEDPVGIHVPGLPAWGDQVTVADLVVHTSGIPDYIDLLDDEGVALTAPADQEDALASVADADLDVPPGTEFDYSNSNYLLLAELVAEVSGRDLATHLDERVFGPLDLDARLAPGAPPAGAAASYELDDGWVVADSPWTQQGDGGVWTTPTELVRYAATSWSDDPEWAQLGDLGEQIGRATATGEYRLGIEAFDADGEVLLGHEGSWSGFETQFLVAPERQAAVALTCTSPDVDVDLEGLDGDLLDLWTG